MPVRSLSKALCMLVGIACSTTSNASLIDRGDGLIYDDVLNITWLQDANHAETSGFDADGRMSWLTATTWADDLIFGGFDDWRLPITAQPDLSCSDQASFPGFPDQGRGFGCAGGEMGHLFYVDGIEYDHPG